LFIAFLIGTYNAPVQDTQAEVPTMKRQILSHGPPTRTTPPQDPNEPWIETICWSPRVFLYHNFLTSEECEEIIKIGEGDVSRSLVVGDKGGSVESRARTSSGVFFVDKYMRSSPLLRDVERRISEWTYLPVENGEAFYLLRYEVGQEYKPHTDWFSRGPDGGPFKQPEGNRYATVLTYLRTPDEGGDTIFPNANVRVPAKQGNAVFFYNLDSSNHPDGMALHGGEPVLGGMKWAMTKWIRENKFWRYEDHLSQEEKQQLKEEDSKFRINRQQKIKSVN